MLSVNWLKPKEKAAASILKVAGIAYYQLQNIYHHLTPGVKLTLKREKHNKHDKMAVAVYYRSFKVGYLPCVGNTEIAENLDNGTAFEVKVFTSVKDKYLPTEELYIAIETSK